MIAWVIVTVWVIVTAWLTTQYDWNDNLLASNVRHHVDFTYGTETKSITERGIEPVTFECSTHRHSQYDVIISAYASVLSNLRVYNKTKLVEDELTSTCHLIERFILNKVAFEVQGQFEVQTLKWFDFNVFKTLKVERDGDREKRKIWKLLFLDFPSWFFSRRPSSRRIISR